jgi:hypothetical protein
MGHRRGVRVSHLGTVPPHQVRSSFLGGVILAFASRKFAFFRHSRVSFLRVSDYISVFVCLDISD